MVLYLCSFLDRTNIGNARILGMEDDIGITGGQYNTALAVFFISYSLFEVPSNILLKRFQPRFWIAFVVIGFGTCCMCIGFVQNYGGLVATRFLLGVFEAGLFPGSQFYLSSWYKRNEFGIRSAIFSSAASAAGSFGGLLAAAIAQMDGVGGYAGWRWIFLIEGKSLLCLLSHNLISCIGAATICLGVASIFLIQEWPDKAKFLNHDDRLRVYYRLKNDQQASAEHEGFRWAYIREAFTDPKTYTMMIIKMGNGCSLYAVSLTLPTIVRQLGFTATTAQLLTVPPYFVAMVFTIGMSWLADRIGQRGYCTLATSGTGVIGFILLMTLEDVGGRYFALYLVTAAIYPCVPLTIAWTTNNVEGILSHIRSTSYGLTFDRRVQAWRCHRHHSGMVQPTRSSWVQCLPDERCSSLSARLRYMSRVLGSFPLWGISAAQILPCS